jgi:flotillin
LASVEIVLVTLMNVVVIAFVLVIYASRYKRVPPNMAMVVYGRALEGGRGYKVYSGGGRWIRPIIETYEFLSLEPFVVEREFEDVVADARGADLLMVRVHVKAVARISDDPGMLRTAASMLLHKPSEEVERLVAAVLEGHTRGVVASERWGTSDAFLAQAIQGAAEKDLAKLGIAFAGDLMVRQEQSLKDAPRPSAENVRVDLENLKGRVRRLEEHLGVTRVEVGGARPKR